jgi:hypothetical protein
LDEHQPADEQQRVAAGLEVARILADHCDDAEAAIEALEQRIRDGAPHPGLRQELATRLRASGQYTRAIEQLQAVLALEPSHDTIWRELAITYESIGREREARVASLPLLVMGLDDEGDRRRIQSAEPRPANVRPKSLRRAVLGRLGTPRPEDAAAGALLEALGPALTKLYPPELQSYGLATRDRLPTEANHPLREIANRIGAALDIRHFDLFLHRIRNRSVTLELGTHPALLVPAMVMEKDSSTQAFLLTRPMVQIARGYQAVEKLTPRELDVLLASAARLVDPSFGKGLTSEEFLNEQARRLQRAISRRDRRAVLDAAIAYSKARRVKFDRWVHATERTATRVALLLCDDLGPLAQELQGRIQPERAAEGETFQTHPTFVDALKFWASPAAMHLREHMGLLPPP